MNTANVREWSVDDVANWLRQEKFASFAGTFTRYRIDGIALYDLQKDRFDTLTRSSMGRDDRASMLWKNINIIKSRAKSKNTNSNFNKNNRKPPPQDLGPPEPPQRDYRTDDYPPEPVGVEEETYEVFHEDESAQHIESDFEDTEDDNIDCFTDDDEIESDNGEYLDPTEDVPIGPPQVPSRPTNLNSSWGPSTRSPLTELQKGLMRTLSERAVSKIPHAPQDQKRNTMPAYDTEHDSELYLAPAEDDTYDVPENDAHDDEIYDIPDDPSSNVPAPSSRQPPISQQHNRHGAKHGPRIPPARTPQFPKPGGHHHTINPPAPPIPSRVSPRPITPEEEQEYAFPDETPPDYIEPEGGSSGDENYLEPDLQPPSRNVQQHIQSRRLPTVPQTGAAPVHVPPRPDKHNNLLPASVDVPPVIPSRPQGGRRVHNLEGGSHNTKPMPVFPNGMESARPEPSRSPPRIPTIPPSTVDNEKNENSNASSDTTSRLVQNMKNRFEVDNNNTDSARRPAPRAKIGSKLTDRQYPPPPSSPTHTPSPVVQRPVTSGGNSVPRKPGIPPSTSSTTSLSSISSSSSSGSESGPPARQRKNMESASWAPEMPPLPPSTRRPSQPLLPVPNQSSIHQIHERLAPPQPAKPAPTASRAPPSPSRVRVPPAQPQQVNELEGHPWYNGGIGRQESEKYLHQCRKDGAFIVRNSTRGDPANPYSLALWFNGRVRNLQIRKRKDQRYALGSRKDNELAFETPVQLIEHHMTNSLILAQDEGKTILKVGAPIY